MINKCLFIILLLTVAHPAVSGQADSVFFTRLEHELRLDYYNCTGDTAKPPISVLVVWKHRVDSLLGLPGYGADAAKEYRKKTGRSPAKDGPCAVALWKNRTDSLEAIDSAAAAEKSALQREIDALPGTPCSLDGIPLGISRQSFVLLAGKAGFDMLSEEGTYMLCPRTPVGEKLLSGLFFFDRNGKLERYELNGPSFPADSLDIAVWPLTEYLAAFLRKTIGSPPLRVNRIDRQDITEGKLSIAKMWSDTLWSAAAGISMKKFRYYAKAVVTNRPAPEE